jgi:hypothetical protein
MAVAREGLPYREPWDIGWIPRNYGINKAMDKVLNRLSYMLYGIL